MMSTTNNWWDRMRTQSTLMTIKVESERKKESKRRDIWQKRSVIIHLVTKRPPRPPPPSLPPSFPCPHHPTHREGGGQLQRVDVEYSGIHKHSTISSEITLFHWHENQPPAPPPDRSHEGEERVERITWFSSIHSNPVGLPDWFLIVSLSCVSFSYLFDLYFIFPSVSVSAFRDSSPTPPHPPPLPPPLSPPPSHPLIRCYYCSC